MDKNTTDKRSGYRSANYYSHSSQAYKVQGAEPLRKHRADIAVTETQKKRVKKRLVKTKVETVYEIAPRQKRKTSVLTYAITLAFFAGVMFHLSCMAITSEKTLLFNKLSDEIKTVKQDYSALQASIYDSYNLAEYEQRAINDLGMVKPGPHQIVEINLDIQSSIVRD